MHGELVRRLAAECGFELAGVCDAAPLPAARFYQHWVDQGMAGRMSYLTDHRAQLRHDPQTLLPGARAIISVGKIYHGPEPRSLDCPDPDRGWISRYAWGEDYHLLLRRNLERLAHRLQEELAEPFAWRACVDTAPLLERAYAQAAGLGWIGKNTCVINQQLGSWFFLGELLTTLPLPPDAPVPDRCGSCTRCIDACPTDAIIPNPAPDGPAYTLDARRCISYFTIELRGDVPDEHRPAIGANIFGCDICQDVCPWNRRAPFTTEPAFAPNDTFAPPLKRLAALTPEEFRRIFRHTPVERAKYAGFLRNVAIAMGNTHDPKFREPLERLAAHPNPLVADHARWALTQLPPS